MQEKNHTIFYNIIVYATLIFLILTYTVLMAIWSDRNLDWIFTQINKQPCDVPMWASTIFSFLPISFVFNVVCEFIRFIK